jgi:outer membrane protein assembly factor BamD (BamD/ComL family)
MNRPLLRLAFGFVAMFCLLDPLRAQSRAAADANAAAYEIYSSGDYRTAATAYEKLLKDFPTDGIVPSAQVQLAFCYYFLAQFDAASGMLAKALSGPPLPPELKQIADGFLPQILSAKAAAIPPADPQRASVFQEAIGKFNEYIAKYPQTQDLENSVFGRAAAEYQAGNLDAAVKDLEANLQKFPQSGATSNTKSLLALALATQGSAELMKGDASASGKGFAF